MFFSAVRRQLTGKPLLVLMLIMAAGFLFVMWRKANSPVQQHIEAGVRFQQNGQGAAAVQQWHQAVQEDPNNAEAWELLGDYYLAAKDYANARNAFERVLKLNKETPDLYERLALCALQLHNLPSARSNAENALKITPESVVALQVMAEVEKQSGQSDARLKYLQQLADLQPNNTQALSDLINELGERQEYDKSLPFIDRLVSLSPDSSSAYYLRGLAFFKASINSQSIARAEADFQKVLQLDPTNIEAHRYLGRIYLQRNQPRLAIAQFEAVGRGRPYASAHFLELSNAYRQIGNQQRAEQLRTLFTRLNQFNARMIAGKKAIELRPDNADNYLQLSLLLMHGIESDENFYQLYRYRFFAKDLQSIEYYMNKAAQIQPRSQQIQKAVQQLESSYLKHLQTGLQALRRLDNETAQRNLGRAALLYPNDERTLDALRQIPLLDLNLSPNTPSTPGTGGSLSE